MIFETTINFEPVSLKRHRHRLKGGTYDPSKKDKDNFIDYIFIVKDLKTITRVVKNLMNSRIMRQNIIQIIKI
jgi:hypothetical protein